MGAIYCADGSKNVKSPALLLGYPSRGKGDSVCCDVVCVFRTNNINKIAVQR